MERSSTSTSIIDFFSFAAKCFEASRFRKKEMEKEESWSRNFDRLSKNLKKTSIRKRNVQLTGDVAELSVLADLVWRPGADGVAVDIDARLLTHVQPDDAAILRPLLAHLATTKDQGSIVTICFKDLYSQSSSSKTVNQ